MNKTKIEWCDFTWNPVVGCTGGCPYCYARKMSARFHRDFTPHWVQKNFDRPMPKKPSRIFVNSMSDIADWKEEWDYEVSCRIGEHSEHLFLFLTKRPWACSWEPWSNVRLGYSVTRQADLTALEGKIYPPIDFLSIEPIHGHVDLEAWRPGWIIVGAETGNRKERVTPDPGWIHDIYDYAIDNGIPLFFKESLRSLWPFDGIDYFPQEYPK